MRYAMMLVVAAVLLAPMVGCTEKTEHKKNPITGSETNVHTMAGNE